MGGKSSRELNKSPSQSSVGSSPANKIPPTAANGSRGQQQQAPVKSQYSEPLLSDNKPGQAPRTVRRRSSLQSLTEFDKELKQWDEQYDDARWFYGGITVLFIVSYAFARLIGLNTQPPYGPVSVGKVMSSYVVFVPLAFVLRTVARVRLLSVLCGGIGVGIFWSLLVHYGGNDEVSLTAGSMECCWSWYHFLIFGFGAVAVLLGMKGRYDEVKEKGSWQWSESRDVVWTGVGIVLVVVGWLSGAHLHIHHWFIGFALTLAAASLRGFAGFFIKAFGFGLFLHGAACWGIGDLFSETVVTTTTLSPAAEEVEDFVPIVLLIGAVGAFWTAKYKELI